MLPIGEFSKISNVTAKTLRYYDEINLLKPVHVKNNGYRYYSVGQLKDILLINKLKMYCFSLEEIAEVLGSPYDDSHLHGLIKAKQQSIQEKVEGYQYILKQLGKDISNLERGIHIMAYLDDIEVKMVELQNNNVLFFRQKMSVQDFGKYMGKLFETAAKRGLTITGPPMTIYHDEEFNPADSDIEVALPVKEVEKGTRAFEGGLFAMSTLKGPYQGLTSVYTKLEQWLEDEGYKMNGEPFEIYLTDPNTGLPPEEYVTEVYFPIKK
ncbi:MAG: MerR family transcriptional regulator [Clostridiales bacterium]|nr:MerR family transcriptional regulator [Clostridiales bacterium]